MKMTRVASLDSVPIHLNILSISVMGFSISDFGSVPLSTKEC